MTPFTKLLVRGASIVLVYDVVVSLMSKYLGLPYGNFSAGSLLIYAAVGYLVARGNAQRIAMPAFLAGATVGFWDATAGWAISCLIGPGRPTRPLTATRWIVVAFIVSFSAAVLAAIGYGVERLVARYQARV